MLNILKIKDRVKEIIKKNKNFLLYISIGFTGLTLDMITFYVLVHAFNVNHLIANPIGMSVGIINNFILNALFNFKKTDKILLRFISFYSIGLVGIVISDIFIYLVHNILFGSLLYAFISSNFNETFFTYELMGTKAMSIVLIAIIQFFLNKKISFRN